MHLTCLPTYNFSISLISTVLITKCISDPLMVDGLIDHADHPGNITSDHSTKGMYEGKNVHYSAVDGKPLCSYSGKLCKQRRLNGYAFCIRHVLEDPGARFKQCQYVARYNNQRCTNPIPDNEDRMYVECLVFCFVVM